MRVLSNSFMICQLIVDSDPAHVVMNDDGN